MTIRTAGDSISSCTEQNFCWQAELCGYDDYFCNTPLVNYAFPFPNCSIIEVAQWPQLIADSSPGDTAHLMCRSIVVGGQTIEESHIEALDAIVFMKDTANANGLNFVYSTQPAWHLEQQPLYDADTFYNLVREELEIDGTTFIDLHREWMDAKWYLDENNYTDGVHMSELGAVKVADSIGEVLLPEPVMGLNMFVMLVTLMVVVGIKKIRG